MESRDAGMVDYAEIAAARMASIAAIPDSMIDAALNAIVPGGSRVAAWLPQKDAWTPSEVARDVIRHALHAALATNPIPAAPPVDAVPQTAPGHWTTPAGQDMALATFDDPHMARSRERISDFALANEVFLSPGIANLTDAKERIRWLSVQLLMARLAAASKVTAVREGRLTSFDPTADELEATGTAPWQGSQPIEGHAKQWKGRQWVPLEAAIADVQFWQRRDFEHERSRAMLAFADATNPIPAAPPVDAIPVGWRMVPIEPTEVMLRAAYLCGDGGSPKAAYAAMLAAAPTPPASTSAQADGVAQFSIGDRVEKTKGSSWRGIIVGTYSTSLTAEGYAVESEREPGSVQIYPAAALRSLPLTPAASGEREA